VTAQPDRLGGFIARNRTAHPAALHPPYKTGILRSPRAALLSFPSSLSEETGPVFGQGLLGARDADMITNFAAPGESAILLPLVINVVIQIGMTVAIAYLVLFRLLGRDYEAAVTAGGFMGFGLSPMPVAMATMDEGTRRYGAAPKAFLLVTPAGSFFVDLANAFVAKGFLALPMFAIAR